MKMNLIASLGFALLASAAFGIDSGSPAPDFTAVTSEGKEVKLSDYKGKVVVLEWLNHGCPFVKKHYRGKNMQALQEAYTKKDVVWLSVISSSKGAQGWGTAEDVEKERKDHGSKASAILLDETGKVGRLYGAETTPHMYVVDKKGVLAYQGAIDDQPYTGLDTLKKVERPFFKDAMEAVLAGKTPAKTLTKAYGCSVKY